VIDQSARASKPARRSGWREDACAGLPAEARGAKAGTQACSAKRVARWGALACTVLLMLPASLRAGQEREAAAAVDTAMAIDETVDEDGNRSTGITLDGVASFQLGHGLQVMTRPYLQRIAGTGEWNAQVWMAAVRYERTGAVAVRLDAGLIPSPIGIANLMLRPQLNPTIAQPSSLFTTLPAPVPRSPRTTLLGAMYPVGAALTLSGIHWDARAAMIDTSPLRSRRIFANYETPNPPRFVNAVIGGGITPFVGLRVGASVVHGGWLKANEAPTVTSDRDATIVTIESELSFRHTKVTAEWVRDVLETAAADRTIDGWFVQGQQTLAPRWFAAARVERMSSPPGALPPATSASLRFTGIEETLGYRLTPELTVRVSHRARELFGSNEFAHTGAVSLVWWKRWM
jgi:hypothetical protein